MLFTTSTKHLSLWYATLLPSVIRPDLGRCYEDQMLRAFANGSDLYAISTGGERIAVDVEDAASPRPPKVQRWQDFAAFSNGALLALRKVEVLPMHLPFSLRISALGLALSSVAFAQNPVPTPPAPLAVPPDPAAGISATPQQVPAITQSSRIRAFNAAPGGEVRSLYLQNGSVVDLAPGLGGQIGSVVRKGEKITVTGTKSEIKGQSLVEAFSVRLNEQTFSANAPAPGPLSDGVAPPPQGALQPPPAPSPQRRNNAATPAPCGATAATPPTQTGPNRPPSPPPGFEAGPPPPPPTGAAPPPPPDGLAPPPPPQS